MAEQTEQIQSKIFVTLALDTVNGSVEQVLVNGAPAEDLFFAIAFAGRVNGSTALIPVDAELGERLNSEAIRIQERVGSVVLQHQIRAAVDRRIAQLTEEEEAPTEDPPENDTERES